MRQRLEELCAELAPVFDREELPPEELAARRVQREVARVRVGEHGRVRGRERVSRLDLAAFEARVAAVVVGERADPREPVREHAARRVPLVGEPDDAAPDEYASFVEHAIENSYLNGETIRLDGSVRMQ